MLQIIILYKVKGLRKHLGQPSWLNLDGGDVIFVGGGCLNKNKIFSTFFNNSISKSKMLVSCTLYPYKSLKQSMQNFVTEKSCRVNQSHQDKGTCCLLVGRTISSGNVIEIDTHSLLAVPTPRNHVTALI